MVRLGSDGCGWWVPKAVVRPRAIAYCAGAGEDISFDLELHRRGLTVVTIDPTPRAIAHVDSVQPLMDAQGHGHIDRLTVDIQGSESTVLPHLLEHGLRPAVVCFEYDQPQSSRSLLWLLGRFRSDGYELVHSERWNFTMASPDALRLLGPSDAHPTNRGAAPSTTGPDRR